MQRNSYWPLKGPSFSRCSDSIVVFHLAARNTEVGFWSNFAPRMASRPPNLSKE
jgi:hypothetical protein